MNARATSSYPIQNEIASDGKRIDLNLLHATVEIVGTLEEVGGAPPRYVEATKTVNSRRKLSVPPFLVDELRDHLSEAPPSDLVFTTVEGQLLRRNNFRQRYWLPAVEEAGLAPLRFHDLRHTCESLLIAQGAHAKEIQVRLGPRLDRHDYERLRAPAAEPRRAPDGRAG